MFVSFIQPALSLSVFQALDMRRGISPLHVIVRANNVFADGDESNDNEVAHQQLSSSRPCSWGEAEGRQVRVIRSDAGWVDSLIGRFGLGVFTP